MHSSGRFRRGRAILVAIGQLRITLFNQTDLLNHNVMADMKHLFREQEMRAQAEATGRPTANDIFKTALYRAEKAQYNMRMKIGKAEAEEVVIYAESVPRNLKRATDFTFYRKNNPQVQLTLTRTEMYALLGKIREALKL